MDEINTPDEFDQAAQQNDLRNKKINIEISIPYIPKAHRSNTQPSLSIEFENCIFKEKLQIKDVARGIIGRKERIYDIVFKECKFPKEINAENSNIDAKIKFRECHFEDNVNFSNTTFNQLADFWKCTFYKSTIFYKTDFMATAVFTGVNFKSNALFTYTTFERLGIFSRAKFEDSGLDLSQSVINGNLTFFQTNLNSYNSKKIDSDSTFYDDAIEKNGIIPTQNKQETFRIIKQQLEEQNNFIVAEKYTKLEKRTLLKSYFQIRRPNKEENRCVSIKNYALDLLRFIISIPNILILALNFASNNFKTNWLFSLVFIFALGYCFDLWLSNISSIYLDDKNSLLKLINPTDFSLYNSLDNDENAYRVYFVGKIVIGFGIYQLIQAFRKFK